HSVTLRRGLGAKPIAEKTLSEPEAVSRLMEAIGLDQVPTDRAPRCMPDVTLVFHDRSGRQIGTLSLFCSSKVDRIAGYRLSGLSRSITLRDVAAIERILIEAGVWSRPPGAGTSSVRCGTGGTPIEGDWTRCKGVVGGECCYQTAE